MGAVVRVKEYERVFAKSELIQSGDQSSHQFVHIGDHIGEEFDLFYTPLLRVLPFLRVGGGHHRPVRKSHGEIEKHGVFSMAFHEIQEKLNRAVRTVFSLFFRDQRTIAKIGWVGVARTFVLGVPGMEQAVLVESRLVHAHTRTPTKVGVGEIRRVVGLQLPLSRDTGPVSRFLHQVPESLFPGIEDSEIAPVAVVVFPRHDLHPRGGAKGLGVGVSEAHPIRCKGVDLGCGVGTSPVASEAIDSDVIRHDQQNVGSFGFGRKITEMQEEKASQKKPA